MPSWSSQLRSKFPALRSLTYLNTASAGPLALEVARAGFEVYESMLAGGDADWETHAALVEEAREALAMLAGCTPQELAFTRNASTSAALAAQLLWDAGKRTAVALEDEFPASTLPFLHRGFDVRFVPSEGGSYDPARLAEALAGRDVLIASHVMYRTGRVLAPALLGQLAAAAGAQLVLSATQSLGALQVDFKASGAAFLVGTSHKWLCAGYGGGYLAIRADLLATWHPPVVGWLSQRDPGAMVNDRLDLVAQARVLEGGCAPYPVLLALGAAVRLWLWAGPARVEARVRMLTRDLRTRLRDAGFDAPALPEAELSGITIVKVAEGRGKRHAPTFRT